MKYKMANQIFELHEILHELLRRNRMNVAELARRVNLPQPTIQRIASGVYKNPRNSTLEPIAQYFDISIEQLRGTLPLLNIESKTQKIKSLPLLNTNQILVWPKISLCDINQFIISDAILSDEAFAISMPDDSMYPAILKGSILLVDPSYRPHHKSYIVIKLGTSSIHVRQLISDGVKHFIKPLSPELISLGMTEVKDIKVIVGVVMEVRQSCEESEIF